MPMYGSFDDKFNAALAGKLEAQKANAAANTTGANAQMLNAQATMGQVGDLNYWRHSMGDADMMNAGTNRGTLAAANPMGFSADQVGSFGLRSSGFSPTANATGYGDIMYGPGGAAQTQARAAQATNQGYQKWADTQNQSGAGIAPPQFNMPRARGGVIGDVNQDTGRDTQDVRARPGEYFINPETVTHGFGGGNYENGVRNLDEIVRRSTGREPGPTYPKGKAGYARSGAAQPASDMSDADWNKFIGRFAAPAANSVAGMPRLPAKQFDRALTPDLTTPYSETDAAREAAVARRPTLSPAAAAGGGTGTAGPVNTAGTSAPVALTDPQWNAHVGGLRTGAGGYPILDGGANYSNEGRQPPVVAAPNYSNEGRQPLVPGAPNYSNEGRQPALLQDTPYSNEGRQPVKVGDNYSNEGRQPPKGAAPATGPIPTLRETAISPNITGGVGYAGNDWAIRDKIRGGAPAPDTLGGTRYIPQGAGGQPGEQVGIDYGPGFGMGPKAARIIATADKTGRFNSFSNLGMARGGRVIGKTKMPKGLRMAKGGRVPGFQNSGTDGWPPGTETWSKQNFVGPPEASSYNPYGGYAADAAEAAAQGAPRAAGIPGYDPYGAYSADARAAQTTASPASRAWTRYNPNVGAAAQKVVNVAKAALPEVATMGKGLRWAGKAALPFAIYKDASDVYNVATDPRTSGAETASNVASEVGTKAGDWAGAMAGAGVGTEIGALGGPFAPVTIPIGAAIGGIGGYYGMDKLQGGIRQLLGGSADSPAVLLDKQKTAEQMGPPLPSADQAGQQPQPAAAPQAEQPAGPPPPSLRDVTLMNALALGYGGTGARDQAHSLLGYLGQTDTLRQQYQLAAMQAQREHEKDIEASIAPNFKTKVTDPKTGKVTETDDLAARARFDTELANRVDPVTKQRMSIYDMSRPQRDAIIGEWKARDKVDQRGNAAMTNSSWYPDQAVPQRTTPFTLRTGPDSGLGLRDVLASPNIHTGDWLSSFLGGSRNQVAMRTVYNPATRRNEQQLFPAAKILGDQPGQVDVDSRYALGQ